LERLVPHRLGIVSGDSVRLLRSMVHSIDAFTSEDHTKGCWFPVYSYLHHQCQRSLSILTESRNSCNHHRLLSSLLYIIFPPTSVTALLSHLFSHTSWEFLFSPIYHLQAPPHTLGNQLSLFGSWLSLVDHIAVLIEPRRLFLLGLFHLNHSSYIDHHPR
jgi:hypothetical protein